MRRQKWFADSTSAMGTMQIKQLENLVKSIQNHPTIYLTQKSTVALLNYLEGWAAGRGNEFSTPEFEEWLHEKRGWTSISDIDNFDKLVIELLCYLTGEIPKVGIEVLHSRKITYVDGSIRFKTIVQSDFLNSTLLSSKGSFDEDCFDKIMDIKEGMIGYIDLQEAHDMLTLVRII